MKARCDEMNTCTDQSDCMVADIGGNDIEKQSAGKSGEETYEEMR
jgi:hypothetical protein